VAVNESRVEPNGAREIATYALVAWKRTRDIPNDVERQTLLGICGTVLCRTSIPITQQRIIRGELHTIDDICILGVKGVCLNGVGF
jgi:hypothetical protein